MELVFSFHTNRDRLLSHFLPCLFATPYLSGGANRTVLVLLLISQEGFAYLLIQMISHDPEKTSGRVDLRLYSCLPCSPSGLHYDDYLGVIYRIYNTVPDD
jgi:hypothetical protein